MNQADHKMYFMNDCDKKLKKSLPKQSKNRSVLSSVGYTDTENMSVFV